MPYPHHEHVIRHLWQSTAQQPAAQLYAVLDAARNGRIYSGIVGAESDYCCLYRGAAAQELAAVAPYLVSLQPDGPFTNWLISQGWGESWGIFLESSAPFNELRRHFRRFLMVYDEQGKPLYFRYYDPRVFRVYLPTCNEMESKALFGPVQRYYVEGEDAATMLQFSYRDSTLAQRVIRLVGSA